MTAAATGLSWTGSPRLLVTTSMTSSSVLHWAAVSLRSASSMTARSIAVSP